MLSLDYLHARNALTQLLFFFFFSSRRRHTRFDCDWSSDVCSSDLSRGDKSGTHAAELALWKAADIDPAADNGTWYRSIGQGMGAALNTAASMNRSEERRVGKECRSRWSPYH